MDNPICNIANDTLRRAARIVDSLDETEYCLAPFTTESPDLYSIVNPYANTYRMLLAAQAINDPDHSNRACSEALKAAIDVLGEAFSYLKCIELIGDDTFLRNQLEQDMRAEHDDELLQKDAIIEQLKVDLAEYDSRRLRPRNPSLVALVRRRQ